MAVLWHLPQASDLAELPLLERGRARTYLAQQELATGNGWCIVSSTHAGHTLPVLFPVEMLHHNLLAVARTGKGKSTLFLHLAQAVLSETSGTGCLFVMEQVNDPVLLSWWQYYYEPMDLRFQMEVISSVLNNLSKFASSRTTRRILGQPRSTINFTESIRSGKILLVSTASGIVGADVSALLGATLLGLFNVTLAEQTEVVRAERRQFLALIDEFQVYQGADFGTILAELRKYGGSFGLATQSLSYLDRLDRTLRSTVLSNVDHLFAFAMSGEDARMLHELDGIEEDDITNLDDFTCYAKLALQGRRLPVFSLRLDPPARGNNDLAKRIRSLFTHFQN